MTFALGREQRGIVAAVAGSIGVHVLLLLLLSLLGAAASRPVALPRPEPIRVVVASPPPPAPRRVIATNPADAPESPVPPEQPLIEADRNVAVAGERAGAGPAGLPDQDGRRSESMQFDRQAYTPDRKARLDQPNLPPVATPLPTPHSRALATPEPALRHAPAPDALARLRPRATPAPLPDVPPLVRPERAAEPSRYRPETQPTRIVGGISNRGRPSVASLATPLGRYRKQIEDAIGSRWYHYVQNRMDLLQVGTVRLKFRIGSDGRVEGMRVLANTANEAFATCSVQAVADAEMPPIPADVAATLENGELEVEYSFTLY